MKVKEIVGVNVNCSSANNYQDPVNAAAFLDMGGYICSGSMINNTNNDLTPYFLTAWHCIDGSNVNTFRFYLITKHQVAQEILRATDHMHIAQIS